VPCDVQYGDVERVGGEQTTLIVCSCLQDRHNRGRCYMVGWACWRAACCRNRAAMFPVPSQ
jgi:hypothetical protein